MARYALADRLRLLHRLPLVRGGLPAGARLSGRHQRRGGEGIRVRGERPGADRLPAVSSPSTATCAWAGSRASASRSRLRQALPVALHGVRPDRANWPRRWRSDPRPPSSPTPRADDGAAGRSRHDHPGLHQLHQCRPDQRLCDGRKGHPHPPARRRRERLQPWTIEAGGQRYSPPKKFNVAPFVLAERNGSIPKTASSTRSSASASTRRASAIPRRAARRPTSASPGTRRSTSSRPKSPACRPRTARRR